MHAMCPLHKSLGEAFCVVTIRPSPSHQSCDTGLSYQGRLRTGWFDPSWCSFHLELTPPLWPQVPLMMSYRVRSAVYHMKGTRLL